MARNRSRYIRLTAIVRSLFFMKASTIIRLTPKIRAISLLDVFCFRRSPRPELDSMLNDVRKGDTIVFWKLDRLGRSLKHLVELMGGLSSRGVGLQSLNDPIDTTNSQGRLIFNLFASLAEFERELIRERTQAGLIAARARGRLGGRPKGLSNKAKATAMAVETLYKERRLSISAIGVNGLIFPGARFIVICDIEVYSQVHIPKTLTKR